MTIARTFILHGPAQAKMLHAFLKQNSAAMVQQGRPLEVTVKEHKAKRSTDQNSLMWAILSQIADQAWVGGRQYSAEVWNIHCKRELLPEKTARGVEKWAYLPNGARELAMSTTDLDTSEMALYIDQLIAMAVSELGVQLEAQTV